MSDILADRYQLGPVVSYEKRAGYVCANCGQPSGMTGHWRDAEGGFTCVAAEGLSESKTSA